MNIHFRHEDWKNDALHFFGASLLSLLIFIGSMFYFNYKSSFMIESIFLSYLVGIGTTNICGLIWELLEWKVLIDYRNPWFKNKSWIVKQLLSSDRKFDIQDIKLNFYGSVLFMIFFID